MIGNEEHIRSFVRNIGRVLGSLEETGLAESSIVVFTSDNDGENFVPLVRGEPWQRSRPRFAHFPHYGNMERFWKTGAKAARFHN